VADANPEPACDQWLPLLAAHLPASLVAPEARDRLAGLMPHLPATASEAIEIPLGSGDRQVDLGVRVSHPAEARWIARWIRPADAGRFLLSWAEKPDPGVQFLWLEFDLPSTGADPRAPLLIPHIGRHVSEDGLLNGVLRSLRRSPPTPPQLATVRRALGSLPPGSHCSYVFDLRPRGTEAVRLSFANLTAAAMREWLVQLGRPDLARAAQEAAGFVEEADRCDMSFDIDTDGAIGPRVGIEISFGTWPGKDQRWPRLFDRLVDTELCSAPKREAVLAWSGYDSRKTAPALWPPAPLFANSYLVRWISHVKLVCVPGCPMEAKVYLLFGLWTRGPEGRLKEGAAGLDPTV
jgi:hypothetical protein